MEIKERTIQLNRATGALKGAEIDFYTKTNDINGEKDTIILKIKNNNYSKYTAPVNYIIDCLLIPGIEEFI